MNIFQRLERFQQAQISCILIIFCFHKKENVSAMSIYVIISIGFLFLFNFCFFCHVTDNFDFKMLSFFIQHHDYCMYDLLLVISELGISTLSMMCNDYLFWWFCITAVTWLKYCRYGVKLHPINQSINQSINYIPSFSLSFCAEKSNWRLNRKMIFPFYYWIMKTYWFI